MVYTKIMSDIQIIYMQQQSQQQSLTDTHHTPELSVTEILQILKALDGLIEKEKKDDSPLKDTSAYSDAMMVTFILCSTLSIVYIPFQGLKALADLIIYFITSVFWNGVDATALVDSVKDFFAHKDAESRRAAIAGMGSVGVMTGATLWSLIEVGLSGWQLPTAASIATGGAVVSAGFAAGIFSFSLAMFASAYQSYVAMKRAKERSTYDGLLKYKIAQLAEKEAEQKKLETKIQETKIQALQVQQTGNPAITSTIEGQTTLDSSAITQTNKEETPLISSAPLTKISNKIRQLEEKKTRTETDIANLNNEITKIRAIKEHFSEDSSNETSADQNIIRDVLATDLMLKEQSNIYAAKQLDTWASLFAGIGFALVAATPFCPPLVIPGFFCCAVAAAIKLSQLNEKHLAEGTVNQTSRNEREQVFLATAKELKKQPSDSEITADRVQSDLLRKYCERRKLDPEAFSNDINQKRTAVDLECKHQYAQKGILERAQGRATIASTRFCGFFSSKSQDRTSPTSSVVLKT